MDEIMCLYGGHIKNTIKHNFVLENIQKLDMNSLSNSNQNGGNNLFGYYTKKTYRSDSKKRRY